MSGYVVVPGLREEHVSGGLVYWELAGDVERKALCAHLAQEGLPETYEPPRTTPAAALRRAVTSVAGGNGIKTLVRPLDDGRVAVLPRTEDGEGKPEYRTAWVVGLEGTPERPVVSGTVDPNIVDDVDYLYDDALLKVSPQDLTDWLARIAARCGAVRLRSYSGFYFIPRNTLEVWRTVTGALRAASRGAQTFEIPALRAAETVRAVLASLRAETEEALRGLEAELNGAEGAELGVRALRTRAGRVAGLEEKLATYANVLGEGLQDVTEKLQTVGARLAAAELAAEAAKEGAK